MGLIFYNYICRKDALSFIIRDILSDWLIDISENNWINNRLNLFWVEEIFYKHIYANEISKYRLLNFDDYKNYIISEFDEFCIQNMIISLYRISHSSYLLPSLDIDCFLSFK